MATVQWTYSSWWVKWENGVQHITVTVYCTLWKTVRYKRKTVFDIFRRLVLFNKHNCLQAVILWNLLWYGSLLLNKKRDATGNMEKYIKLLQQFGPMLFELRSLNHAALIRSCLTYWSRNRSVGIVTGYRLDERGIWFRFVIGVRNFLLWHGADRSWVPPKHLYKGYRILLPRSKSRRTAVVGKPYRIINPLNAELNPICYFLALLWAHHFLHVSRIRVNTSAHCSGHKQVKG